MSIEALFGGRVVTAWVCVAEVLDEDGNRRLDLLHADAGQVPLPWWTVQGLLSAVLETYESIAPTTEDEDGD